LVLIWINVLICWLIASQRDDPVTVSMDELTPTYRLFPMLPIKVRPTEEHFDLRNAAMACRRPAPLCLGFPLGRSDQGKQHGGGSGDGRAREMSSAESSAEDGGARCAR